MVDDARIRRALHRLDEPVPTEGVLERVRRRKRRYRLARRLQAAGLTVGVVAATGAGVYGLTTLFGSDDVRPAGSGPSATEGRTACPGDIPFQPSYLPQGFGREPVEGPAPGAPPAQPGQTVIHFRDQQGRALEIRRPATVVLEAEEGQETPVIPPLGRETMEPVDGEGDTVHFRDPTGQPNDPCATYSVQAYDVARDELLAVSGRIARKVSRAFDACPELAGSLPPADGSDAPAAAVAFVRATHRGDPGQVRALTDPAAGWPLVPLNARLADEPVTVLADGSASDDGLAVRACGQQVADRSWWVTVDDGTGSASLDVTLYLIRRSDGWKVWSLY